MAEAEELWKANVGKKQKTMGSVNEDGSEVPEGFARVSHVTCAERWRSSAIG